MTGKPNRATDVPRRGLPARISGAILCRAGVYREVGGGEGAIGQAAFVVVLASGVATVQDYGLGWFPMFVTGAVNVLQWPAWSGIAYLVGRGGGEGSADSGTATDWHRVLGALGFARAPGLLIVFAPIIGGIQFAVQVWMLAAGVIGIRESLGVGTLRAVLAALLGMVPYWIVLAFYLH